MPTHRVVRVEWLLLVVDIILAARVVMFKGVTGAVPT